ncbi:MAG: hypothetical protein RH942_17070 [Kiloniellaceae bacterium]
MRTSPVYLIALAAVSALSVTVGLTHYSAAQSAPSELRLRTPELDVVKPSRPARDSRLQVKRPTRPAINKFVTGAPSGGPDTPSQLANLVVIPFYNNAVGLPEGFPEHSYCVKKPTGGTPNQIKFWVRNAGGSDSGSFQWTPSFPNAGAAPAQIIANVPANGQVLITQGIPNGCYDGNFSANCQFSIHLDDHDEVEEWSEANTFDSYCVSPAG